MTKQWHHLGRDLGLQPHPVVWTMNTMVVPFQFHALNLQIADIKE